VPHVIEPSFGVDRLMLAVLTSAHCVDTVRLIDVNERSILYSTASCIPSESRLYEKKI